MEKRTIRIKTWDNFKTTAIALHPNVIVYFLQRAPLSKPPIGLRLMFTCKQTQYVFLDFAKGETLQKTKIPLINPEKGEDYVRDEDIKQFITKELGRNDLLIVCPVWRLEWQ